MTRLLNNKVIAFAKLIRIENLFMMVLTLWLLRSFVLQKLFLIDHIYFSPNNYLYIVLISSVVLIAAAGYMINDYFDVKTDSINHPETVVLDKTIKRRWAIILHLSFTSLGILLGVFVALKIGYLRLSLFHFIAAILLWFYSTRLKMKLLVGNIVVSLLTASVAFIPLVFEIGILQKQEPEFIFNHGPLLLSALKITVLFSVFAFITSMAREMIKDIEDFKGDKASGGATMPIVWGIRTSKFNAFFLLIITALLLSFVLYNSIRFERKIVTFNNIYIALVLILPLIILSYAILVSHASIHFKRASLFLKLIMLAGLCYSLVYYFS